MGLDAVEIVMAVEDAFDIQLADADMEKVRTPRDLIEAVMAKVARAEPSACLTQRAFNLLRQTLLRSFPLKRRDIAPAVRLADIVPKTARAALLEKLGTDFKTGPLPDLVRPTWAVRLLTAQSITVGFLVGFALLKLFANPSRRLAVWAGLFAAVVVHICGWLATRPYRVEFPHVTVTVGDLSRWITAHKADLASPTPGRWTREQVAARVREIVIDQLGCESHYREDALFVEELGVS